MTDFNGPLAPRIRRLSRGMVFMLSRKWLRALSASTAGAFLFLFLLLLLLVFLPGAPEALPVTPSATLGPQLRGTWPIHVVSHGWHTGLILPADRLREEIPVLARRFPRARYLEIGWGDEGFYQASEITAGLTLQALFWSRGAVLHVVGFTPSPPQYFSASEVHQVCLTEEGYTNLRAFIRSSFQGNQDEPESLGPGLYGDSQFYQGRGHYHFLNTCNSWTARGLVSAGLPISARLQLRAGSVMGAVETLPFARCGAPRAEAP